MRKSDSLQYAVFFKEGKRKLEQLQLQIIFLKNRVSEIVQQEINKKSLAKIEYFQNCFIEKDQDIASLKNNIAHQQKLINQSEVSKSGLFENYILENLNGYRMKLVKLENDINLQRVAFYDYFGKE